MTKSIGWKRLLLTSAQKYMHDIQTLGQPKSRVDQFILFLEELHPSVLLRRSKRLGKRAVINIYWHLCPKFLAVPRSGSGIYPYLPWFNRGFLYQFGPGGKILVASGGDRMFLLSWKKAYKLMVQYREEREAYELQAKLDYKLSRVK